MAQTNPKLQKPDINASSELVAFIAEEMVDHEGGERTAAVFLAVLEEIERKAKAGDLLAVQDTCSSLQIAVYQRTMACETEAQRFAEHALQNLLAVDTNLVPIGANEIGGTE